MCVQCSHVCELFLSWHTWSPLPARPKQNLHTTAPAFPLPSPPQHTEETKRRQKDLERLRRDLGEGDKVQIGLRPKPTLKSEMDINLDLGAEMDDDSDQSADDELEGETGQVHTHTHTCTHTHMHAHTHTHTHTYTQREELTVWYLLCCADDGDAHFAVSSSQTKQ